MLPLTGGGSLTRAPSRLESGLAATSPVERKDEDDELTSFSLTPSLSLVLVGAPSLVASLSEAMVPRRTVDELIRELTSLPPNLPERRLKDEEEEEGALALAMGLVILREGDGGERTPATVLSFEVSTATRVDLLEAPPGSRISAVVVEGFWSSRENTDEMEAWLFSL